MGRTIAWTTLVAGTLDILLAAILSLIYGGTPANMLRRVASGPFPEAADWGAAGSALGLCVHFSLMAVMVMVFAIAVHDRPKLLDRPIAAGIAYGLITYVVMNLVVAPLRHPDAWPPRPVGIATQLFAHILLVGIPIALIAARRLSSSPGTGRWQRAALTEGPLRVARPLHHASRGPPPRSGEE